VAVKIEAFEYTKYGTASGRVSHVSRDAIDVEKRGLLYAVKVTLDDPRILVGEKLVTLGPGMSGVVEIKTGSRRVIEYFLSPLVRHVKEAFRER
jgi:hemolysin D